MSYGIDKVINELKGRCGSKFDIDGIEGMLHGMKHPPMPPMEAMPPMPPMADEGEMTVVEIEAVPEEEVEETKPGEAEKPELPKSDEPEDVEAEESVESEEPVEEGKLEEPTPEEENRMDEVLKAIKTFFPNENTEDVLVRIVSKLIDK